MLMVGCSSWKQQYKTIDLREYLPVGETGTVYISRFNFENTNNKKERKTIVKRTKSQAETCVTFMVSPINNGKQEGEHRDILCATKNKLYRGTESKYPIISLTQKEWYSSKTFSPVPPPHSEILCKIYNTSKIKVEEREKEAITIECETGNSTFLISYAKDYGQVKTVQKVKDFGTIGDFSLENVIRPGKK